MWDRKRASHFISTATNGAKCGETAAHENLDSSYDLPGRACRRIAIEDNAYFFPGSVDIKTLLLLWVGI
jgi:hypothetical protein